MRCIKSFFLCSTLLLALSACSDAMYFESDAYYFDLGIAVQRNDSLCFLMDDSSWIRPDNHKELKEVVENGKRYKLHYRYLQHNKDAKKSNHYRAEVLDLMEVPVYPIELFVNAENSGQNYQNIDIDRLWLAGGFLNISYNCLVNEEHDLHHTQMIRHNLTDTCIHLKLYHFQYEDNQEEEPLTKASFCMSFPLVMIPDYYFLQASIKLSIYENNQWVNYSLKPYRE